MRGVPNYRASLADSGPSTGSITFLGRTIVRLRSVWAATNCGGLYCCYNGL